MMYGNITIQFPIPDNYGMEMVKAISEKVEVVLKSRMKPELADAKVVTYGYGRRTL